MKYFLLVLVATLASAYAEFTVQTGADLVKFRDECKTELNIPDEAIAKFKQWNFEDDHAKCYIECLFKKMNLYAEGNFLTENLVKQLHAEEKKDEINGCIDNTITDSCQKAFAGFECFKKNNLYMIKQSVN